VVLSEWKASGVNRGSTTQRQRTPALAKAILLNQAVYGGASSAPETLASTFNPKVAGSIPARPIRNGLQTAGF
jgi:hypothetical protein